MLWRDHYAILGVPPDATEEAIEAAYRHLSRRYHPSLNPGDPQAAAAFERIENAYRILSDQKRRVRYDRKGHPAPEPHSPLGPGGKLTIEPGSGEGGSFQQLFHALREHARRARPTPGEDLHASVSIPVSQAERGRHTSVDVRRLVPCRACSGRGRVEHERARPCTRCQGTGREVFTKGALSVTCPCADCGGGGLEFGIACPRCHGAGLTGRQETVPLHIPAGVVDGQAVRVAGAGHHGPRGGAAGDLLLICRVHPHPDFRREGPNLHCRVSISIGEAILGGRIPVPTLEGSTATLRIPPGTQNGQAFRLRGRGLRMHDGRRGDLLVAVDVWIPPLADEDAKQLIREFDARTPKPPRPGHQRATVQT